MQYIERRKEKILNKFFLYIYMVFITKSCKEVITRKISLSQDAPHHQLHEEAYPQNLAEQLVHQFPHCTNSDHPPANSLDNVGNTPSHQDCQTNKNTDVNRSMQNHRQISTANSIKINNVLKEANQILRGYNQTTTTFIV